MTIDPIPSLFRVMGPVTSGPRRHSLSARCVAETSRRRLFPLADAMAKPIELSDHVTKHSDVRASHIAASGHP